MARQARVRWWTLAMLAALVGGMVALAPAALADDRASRHDVRVGACEVPTQQLCSPSASIEIDVETTSVLLVEFVPSASGCAPLIGHLLRDGLERFKSPPLQPGQSSGLQDLGDIPPGHHVVSVQAEGVLGGCNTGTLGSWSGTITIVLSSTLFATPVPSASPTPLPTASPALSSATPTPTIAATFAIPTLAPSTAASASPAASGGAASPAATVSPVATTPPTTLLTPFGPVELTSRNMLIGLLAVLGVVFAGLVLFVLRRR